MEKYVIFIFTDNYWEIWNISSKVCTLTSDDLIQCKSCPELILNLISEGIDIAKAGLFKINYFVVNVPKDAKYEDIIDNYVYHSKSKK